MLDMISNIVGVLNTYLYSYVLIAVLLGSGLLYTIYTKGIQFRFKDMFAAISEKQEDSEHKKTISSFEAFAVSTASRVGTGNIAGVSFAVIAGGPGALFWMWITALLGGALAFVESTLAQTYKVANPDDKASYFRGGPAFYITHGLSLKWLATVFAIILIFVFGLSFNALQSNTIADAFRNSFNIPTHVTGVILALVTGLFIFKGLQSVTKASAVIVPIMSLLYLVLCIVIVGINIGRIGEVFNLIFSNAFGLTEASAGILGGVISTGIKRGLFSNEAGMGSAPNAAGAAQTSHPVKQGLIQSLGVFFDTLVICSATGFLILFSGVDYTDSSLQGIALTQQALSSYFGDIGGTFLAICILLLAFSSILGNYFYAESSVKLISKNPVLYVGFKLAVVLAVFAGSVSSFSLVWNIADLLMGFMTLINIYAIVRLSPTLKIVLNDYYKQRSENKNPVFKKSELSTTEQAQLNNVDCW